MGGPQAASVLATVRRDNIEAEGKTWSAEEEAAFKQPMLEQLRARGPPLLRHRAPLGRRHHRAARDPPRAGLALSAASTRRSRRRGSACSGCEGVPAHLVMVGLVPTIHRSTDSEAAFIAIHRTYDAACPVSLAYVPFTS